MKQRAGLSAGLIVAIAAVAGCGGGGTSSSAQGIVRGCASIAPPALLYPAPGATGIAVGHLQLYFGYPANPSPAFGPPTLTPRTGLATLMGAPYAAPSPGPMPPGSASPPPSDQVFVSDVPAYQPSTRYTVSVTSASCNQTFSLGSFST